MPQLTYDETIFCTPTDVKARLFSTGKVAAFTEDNALVYAATVASSIFSTTNATGFIAGQQVAFQTTGTLPAPLQSGIGYYVIAANLSSLTFQISTIVGGPALTITTAGAGTLSVYSSNLQLFIQGKIELSKSMVRQRLIKYLQEKIPGKIASMLAFKRSQMNAMQSDFSRTLELLDRGTGSWNYPTYGYVTFEGLFYSVNNYQTFGQIPVLRVNYGPPTNGAQGTFAALAVNGDLLGDILYGNLWINREVDDPPVSPVWDLFQPKDGINYFLNPWELKHAMVSAAIREMVTDATWRNMAGSEQLVEKGAKNWAIDFWNDQHEKDLALGMECLDINISGSGLMNDWMRGITRNELVICG
jgi:hypothetical protein